MTTIANPRTLGPPRKPQPHQPRNTNHTMAINPYPLTTDPHMGDNGVAREVTSGPSRSWLSARLHRRGRTTSVVAGDRATEMAGDSRGIVRPLLERYVPAQAVALMLERPTGDSLA